jgi:uncharacterized protein YlxP (DUF503 family)
VVIGLLTIELHIPASGSLKEKRQVLKSLLETTRNRFNVSIAEVEHQDLWQRATVAAACVSNDQSFVDQVLNRVLQGFDGDPRVEVSRVELEWL